MLLNWLRRFSRSSQRPKKPIRDRLRTRLNLESLEDRTVPSGNLVAAADAGAPPEVRIFDYGTGALRSQFLAYDGGMLSGVRTAVGDINGDGIDDLITVPGPGAAPHVKVFSGRDGALISSFFAYSPSFTGGVFLASADVNGDGIDDIITGTGPGGGPHVEVFRGDASLIASFFAYVPQFSGGVRVAAGDLNGDGKAEIITGVGYGGGPHVQAFDVSTGVPTSVASFFAYAPNVTTGVFVAAGDTDGDGRAEIITGAGAGGGPHVQVFAPDGTVKASFFALTPTFSGGVRVAARDVNNDGKADILVGTGYGIQSQIHLFSGNGALVQSTAAFPPEFQIGVYVAMSEEPLNLPSTPSNEIQAAYQNLSNLVQAGRPIVVIQQNNNFLYPYPYGIYGFGYGYAYPYFYDAPGLFYSPGYFYTPGYFGNPASDYYYQDPAYDPYYYDSNYYYDNGYYDSGYYDSGYYDGGYDYSY